MIVKFLLAFIFLMLSLLHFYWVFGGKWGLDAVIPVKEDSESFIGPPKIATLIVALGLLFLSAYYYSLSLYFEVNFPTIKTIISWTVPALFLLRAIGEFKYVGFFKKVKNTKFGSMDSRYYSPLCLVVAVLGFCVVYFST